MAFSLVRFARTLLVLIPSIVLVACASGALTASEAETADFGAYPANYQEIVPAFFARHLRDPGSAVYEFEQPVKFKSGSQYGYKVGLYVNAKNGFGGYAGRERKHVFIRNGIITEVDSLSDAMVNKLAK